ncbi:MAG: peptide chain release factor N(5)-glutamine methyltransferase [Chloroflexi bacterium]|nr:peptide chain release factor N(5)-glutamine methyltransferase [Chloroflexota bacterium]
MIPSTPAPAIDTATSSQKTVNDYRKSLCRRLSAGRIESPRFEADLMVRHAMGLTPLEMLLDPSRVVTQREAKKLRDWIGRRIHREPLAYVLGTSDFYGMELFVDHRALIPRPETELLVEKAVENATRMVQEGTANPVVADIGTGSGCIAVSVAVLVPQAEVLGIDISEHALKLARLNVVKHRVGGRITLLQGDLCRPLSDKVNILVANLPYVVAADLPFLDPELHFEPRIALDGGDDGLACIRRFLESAPAVIRDGGVVLLEVGVGQAGTVAHLALGQFPRAAISIFPDLAGIRRVVMVRCGSEEN